MNIGNERAKMRAVARSAEITRRPRLLERTRKILSALHTEEEVFDEIETRSIYERLLLEHVGFSLEQGPSVMGPAAGRGIFVRRGCVKKDEIVAFYPGTVYRPVQDSIFFQSLSNKYILRCSDGILIDGKGTGLSGSIFRSCERRDRVPVGGKLVRVADCSWTRRIGPVNPLNCGQLVNNESERFPANVMYCEFDLPTDFPLSLRALLPNVNFASEPMLRQRAVCLVATRDIVMGEEVLSSYFTYLTDAPAGCPFDGQLSYENG